VGATDLLTAAGFRSSGGGGGGGGGAVNFGQLVNGGNGQNNASGGVGSGSGASSEVVLRLTRDDPALLYIVRSAVCDAATRAWASAAVA
jgi:hypothetical protein